MSLPTTLNAYSSHMDAMDMAEANPTNGVRLRFDTRGKAMRFRQYCYQARKIYRAQTGDDTKWAGITCQLEPGEDGACALRIRLLETDVVSIEPLDGITPDQFTRDRVIEDNRRMMEKATELLAGKGTLEIEI
jgi:hypothetical protein